jgi:hypothetical protein
MMAYCNQFWYLGSAVFSSELVWAMTARAVSFISRPVSKATLPPNMVQMVLLGFL